MPTVGRIISWARISYKMRKSAAPQHVSLLCDSDTPGPSSIVTVTCSKGLFHWAAQVGAFNVEFIWKKPYLWRSLLCHTHKHLYLLFQSPIKQKSNMHVRDQTKLAVCIRHQFRWRWATVIRLVESLGVQPPPQSRSVFMSVCNAIPEWVQFMSVCRLPLEWVPLCPRGTVDSSGCSVYVTVYEVCNAN